MVILSRSRSANTLINRSKMNSAYQIEEIRIFEQLLIDTAFYKVEKMPLSERNAEQSEWLQRVEQSLHAIHIIGKKLVAGRATRKNPGTELLLIAQEVMLRIH